MQKTLLFNNDNEKSLENMMLKFYLISWQCRWSFVTRKARWSLDKGQSSADIKQILDIRYKNII